jgi:hypothetical protein
VRVRSETHGFRNKTHYPCPVDGILNRYSFWQSRPAEFIKISHQGDGFGLGDKLPKNKKGAFLYQKKRKSVANTG